MVVRGLQIKFKRKTLYYLKWAIVIFIVVTVLEKLIIENGLFRRRTFIVQNDLLNYNEDNLRKEWPFQITKHYDARDLRSYTPKAKIVPNVKTAELPGEGGTPVVIPKVLDDIVELSFNEYQINILASEKVSLNRSLPDTRNPGCLDIKYPKLLPSVSIVIAVYNEARSILLRTIWSAINRTPDELLEEIILVDDFSEKSPDDLDKYVAENWSNKVKIVRNEKREGLIRARMIGAENAQGQVIIFLDANVEVNDGWCEPLLSRIVSDRSVVAVPRLDYINNYNMSYKAFNHTLVYGLGWNLFHYGFPLPVPEMTRNRGDPTIPYRTPAIMGMAIAMDREYYHEIGEFDKGLDFWGGENAELSLRAWQCGGSLNIVPCSRVGHFFRPLPYSFNTDNDDEVKLRNNIRVAEVYMDDYIAYFRAVIPPHMKKVKAGDVSERIALRRRLKCKGFHWYLNNIFPESVMSIGAEVIGQIQRVGSKFCLDRLGRNENRQIGIYQCHGHGYSQGFAYQKNQQIVFHHSLCLSLAKWENVSEPIVNVTNMNDPNLLTPDMNTTNHVVLLPCNATNGEKWLYNKLENQIIHIERKMCLATDLWMLVVSPCDLNDERQKWTIIKFEDYKRKLLSNVNTINRGNPT